MKGLRFLIALGLMCLAGCEERATEDAFFDKELTQQNGLQVSRPTGFAEAFTDSGISFAESGRLRSPRTIEVLVSNSQPAALAAPHERVLTDGTAVTFATRELGAGSGAMEYELTAAKPAGERWIVVTAIEQSEFGAPAFETAWRVLENSRLSTRP
ncbi:MAG: Tsi3 family protein [Gammaproteobacteria bacterium]